jgi:ribosome-binding protein aMBF1 (putative translation factor)
MSKQPKTAAKTHGAVIAAEMLRGPDFHEEWEQTALARLVSAQLIDYRVREGLSQRALADRLGVKQPYVARLESGEHNPELPTLVKLSRSLGIEFLIDIRPETRKAAKLVTKRVAQEETTHCFDGVSVVLAAAK